jgi:glutamate-1-semialdehyde 2,1-aminomutase
VGAGGGTVPGMDTSISQHLFERGQRVIPGGVNSPVRAFGSVGGQPRFMVAGDGAYIHDEDGNRYLDLVQSWGPLPLGHARAEVVAAAGEALRRGSTFGAPTRGEVELAEALVEAVPSIEMVRLTSSGTEASMSAVRLARGATGRSRILKFTGHYHGHADALLVDAGSGVATLGIPGSPGVTDGAVADTVLVRWNDRDAVAAAVAEHGDDLAAIVCEPVAANMNLVPPDEGFLDLLRELADRCGAVLVFDEVITGFRMARAGAQGFHGVLPDLTVLGKAIGGGFPLAAVGGRAALMEQLAPVGSVYQAGTLSGNPVAVAAGLAQLRLLTPEVYRELEQVTTRVCEVLRSAFDGAEVTAVVRQHGTLSGVAFTDAVPHDFETVRTVDHARYARFFREMLSRGVYLAPSGYEIVFSSVALDGAALEQLAEAATGAARALTDGP